MKNKTTIAFSLLYIYGWGLTIYGYQFDFEPQEEQMKDLPIILWWNGIGMREDYIISCEERKCVISNSKSKFHKDKYMVYIFYGPSFLGAGLPLPRQDGDLWALVHDESPKNMDWIFTFESTLELFNYTATFKRESHYPFPTHWLPNLEVLTTKQYMLSTEEKNRLRKEEGLAPVLFVHTDCLTPSNREGYIEHLMKHVQVDSYGTCLHNKDFPDEFKELLGFESYLSPKFLKFVARYKFSIAFENALCDDYITEKLWRPLQAGSVPIVLGSPKVKDFLPSNKSAIIVTEFDTVQELAEHIKYLDNNDDEYEKYLDFKHTGISNPKLTSEIARMSPGEDEDQNILTAIYGFECFLCDKLHDARNASENGQPVPESRASLDHFDCPLPTHKFDEDGKSVYDETREQELNFYEVNAKAFRQFYNRGENITAVELYKYTSDLITALRQKAKDEL